MPDYDLGRARGKVTIDVDKRAFRQAEDAVDDVTDATERLGEQSEDTTKQLGAQEKQTKKTTKETQTLADKEAGLAKRMKDAEKATSELNDALDDLNNSLLDAGSSMDDIEKKTKKVTEARKKQKEADENAASAAKALKSELSDLTMVIDKLPDKHEIKLDVDTRGAEDKLNKFNKKVMALRNAKMLGSLAGAGYGPLAKGGLYGSGGGILGGAAGLLGAGATGAGVNTIMGVVQAAGQLSGALGLIPAVAGAAAFSVTSLQVATKGLGDAFGAALEEDPEAFAGALEKLSGEAQELAIGFNTLVPEIKKAGYAIQDAFASGLAETLMPLAQTYMPMITNGMSQIASVANSVVKDLANMFMSPDNMQMVQAFLNNTATAANTLGQAIRPVAQALLDIMDVGGSFLPQLAQDILDVANEFGAWVREMRDSGAMAEWIQTGIDAFKQLWGIIKTLGDALGRVFQIWEETGGGALTWLENIVGLFNSWVNSAEGSNALSQFFTSINEAMAALTPVLKPIMTMLFGTLIPMLANLGTAMAPGLTSFFTQLGEAMKTLAPSIVALAPAFNQMLTTLGGAFVDLVNGIGPQLPGLFQSLADSLTQLAPYLPQIADAMVQFATEIMQYLPGIADDVGYLLPRLIGFIGVIKNLQTALVAAGTQILHWLGQLATGFLNFMTNLTTVWPQQAGEAARGFFANLGSQITGGLSVVYNALTELGNKIQEFFTGLWTKALDAGKALIENLMQGIRDRLGSLGDVAKSIVTTITDWLPGSPAKKGPLSGAGWSYRRGQSLAEDFAAGVDSRAGAVNKSSGSMAAGAGEGMQGFVKDMLELTSFTSRLVGLFNDIANIVFDVVKFATTDPVTGKSTIKPRWERTVSDADLRKQREDKQFSDAWDEANKPEGKKDTMSGRSAREGSLANGVPITVNPDGTISSPDPEWDKLIKRESGGRNIPQGNIGDINNKTGDLAKGYFQITDATWRQYGGDKYAKNAMAATPEQQAEIAANIFRARGGQPWGAVPGGGREDEKRLLAGLGTISTAVPRAGRSTGGTYGLPGGTDTGGYGTGSAKTFPDWVMALADRFGIKPSTYSGHQETDRREEGYAPNPQGLNRGIDWSGPVENMQKFADYLKTIPGDLEQVIWRNPNTGRSVEASGGTLQPGYYGEDTLAGHENHVHTRQSAPIPLPIGTNGAVPVDLAKSGTPGWMPAVATDPRADAIQDAAAISASQGALTPGKALGADLKPDYVNAPGVPENTMVRDADGRLVVADEGKYAEDQLSMNESLLQEMQSQDLALDEAIRIGQDPNSTDAQVANSLSAIDDKIASLAGTDSPEARAQTSALQSIQGQIAGDRGMGQAQNPVDQAQGIFNGAAGMVGDILQVIDGVIKSIGAASEISSTLVRGIKNTEDIYNIIDQVQVFIDLAAKVAGAVSSVANFAGQIAGAAAGGAGPFGGQAQQALQGVAAIAGMVQAVLQAVNAAIDLGQEAYRIGSKYLARFLGYLIGGPAGSLVGDIKFLLDEQTGELHAWSDQNPEDKRTHQVPGWMQSGVDRERGQKIRDLNIYAGPGQDPAETMNAAMWMVTSDQGGVFSSDY